MTRPELAPDAPLHGGMLLPRNETLPPVPLEHTEIQAQVLGPLVETTLTQRFRNQHHAPLDALYIFPLPSEAAVGELELHLGERIIRSEIRLRPEAEQTFREAAERGQGAALLAQERPNLFSVELANLQPGETALVRLRFFAPVPFDDGWFTLTIPSVVLPRYMPAAAPPPDVERVAATPLLPPGAAGHTLAISITVDVGRLAELECPSHTVDVAHAHSRAIVTFRDPTTVPDRDIVLRYRPASASYAAAALTYRAANQPGALLLMLTPSAVPAPSAVLPRELLFVFDRSGSMGGDSIAQARNALRACLRALNPGDTFNIFPFDNHVEQLAPAPLAFTQASVDAADTFIAAIDARGGTEIVGALAAALAQPRDPERLRVIVFLTDGAVGNEDVVLRELAARLNEARVFAFGVGSAVNRFLLDKLAELGRGSVEYIGAGEAIEPAVLRFQRRAALPLIRDLSLDWGGAQVTDLLPTPMPDLYAGQPLVLLARYHGARGTHATVTLRGRTATGAFSEALELELPVATPERQGAWALLPRMWARARLAALEDVARLDRKRAAEAEAEARQLALEHNLLSAHTAFVAVEQSAPNAERRRAEARVVVPIHLPAGTRREAFAPPPPPLPMHAGIMYGASMPAPPSPAGRARGLAPKTPSGMAARFINALRRDVDRAAAPPMPAMASASAGWDAPQQTRREATTGERRDAALRFLARTQAVNGSWAEHEQASALAALAFVQAGHNAQAGDFRPQLARAARWLAERAALPETSPALSQAAQALADNAPSFDSAAAQQFAFEVAQTLLANIGSPDSARAALVALQQLGGDADGAALAADADGAALAADAVVGRPSAATLTLSAALALLL